MKITHETKKNFAITKPIVLVGLMGAGKTTVGNRLARLLGVPFYDSDQEIEKSSSCSIADLFYYAGEEYFRSTERKVIKNLLASGPAVIATGGGAFLNPDIREAVREGGTSVWIKASLPVLLDRVSRRNTRPLLEQGDKTNILEQLMEKRYPVYSEANITVDSDVEPHHKIAKEILSRLYIYLQEGAA